MPIVTPPPVLPPTPPAVVQPVQNQTQTQNQTQGQDNTTNIGQLGQNQNTKSDADSSADSTSTQSSTLSNVQVNQSSNRIEYGTFRVPETTLTISSYLNGGEGRNADYGAVVAVNVPLGGGVRKDVKKALAVQVASDQLAFERTYASVCANLDSDDYSVDNRAQTLSMLKSCRTEISKRSTVLPKPPVVTPPTVVLPPVVTPDTTSELAQLRKDNAELRLLIAQLAEKLDKNTPVPGGY
jgi:hypothetical protein